VLANLENNVADLTRLTCAYLDRLKSLDLREQNGVGTAWVTMTFNVIVPSHRVETVKRKLDINQVTWRHWWGLGCHTHPAFAGVKKTDLSVTDALAPCVIGVPFHTSLTPEQIDVVCESLR
jgi:dTDP-4-amino-4,6-dideoxygalactose transaminase